MQIIGELSAASGSATTRLEATGSSLVWDLGDKPEVLRDLPSLGRQDIKRLADWMAEEGLTATVVSSGRPLMSVGASNRSLLGFAAFGSAKAQPKLNRSWLKLIRR